MKILVLGGTADARKIAAKLIKAQYTVIYSIAGLVRVPKLDCEVISGGFKRCGGLARYISIEAIEAVVDATHPYALKMTTQAYSVCEQLALPYFRYERPPWREKSGDHWISVDNWATLLEQCALYSAPLLTTGQIEQVLLDQIAAQCANVSYRTAALSQAELAENVNWLKAIGPFALEDEKALMQRLKTDVLVSKNAGGEATYAKIVAARELRIPVIMYCRPLQVDMDKSKAYASVYQLLEAVQLCKT